MRDGLSRPDLSTRIYTLGTLLDMARERREESNANRALRTIISDLQVRLDTSFELTAEQKVSASGIQYLYHSCL